MSFVLTVEESEINVIGAALAELPFKVSSGLIQKLKQQVNEQQKPTVTDAELLDEFKGD